MRSFTVNRCTLTLYYKRSISSALSLGSNYHVEVRIISKVLLCVCKHKAAVTGSQLEVGIPRGEALLYQLLLLVPPHCQQGLLLTHCVSHFTVTFMPNNFFLAKQQKKLKRSIW